MLERLTAERAELANGVDSEHPALVAFKKHQNIETLNREILIDLVNYIKIYENGNISVKFKFADEFRRIAEYIEINISEIPAAAGWCPPHHFWQYVFLIWNIHTKRQKQLLHTWLSRNVIVYYRENRKGD